MSPSSILDQVNQTYRGLKTMSKGLRLSSRWKLKSCLSLFSLYDLNFFYLYREDFEFCWKSKLYQKLLISQSDMFPGFCNLNMAIRFRNLADKNTEWVKVSAALVGEEFLVHERNIALLKPVTGTSNIILLTFISINNFLFDEKMLNTVLSKIAKKIIYLTF